MDEKSRTSIALKKFSIISPVLNGQVESNIEYFRQVAAEPIDMPVYGMRNYSVKTLETWLNDYRKYGLEGLIRGNRSDKGKSRKISSELSEEIIARRKANPKLKITVLYEELVKDGLIEPDNIALSTVYRHIEDLALDGRFDNTAAKKAESLRFSYEHVGDMYQGDVMYGPQITIGRKKGQTYLHAFLDDASRYPMYSQFYLSQKFDALRHCFKEAVMRRGIPKMIYTDNGKIYRSQQFEYICASIGCTLLHSQPFEPQGRGKIERFFGTVRMRFLSRLDVENIRDLDTLNERYFKWLEEDYTRKGHSALNGKSPHDVLMSQVSRLRLVKDMQQLHENFFLRVSRKIMADATTQIENILYETDPIFAGKRVEIRYEPEWLNDLTKALLIYIDGKKVGEARKVRFNDNSHVKRKYPGNRRKEELPQEDMETGNVEVAAKNTISYYDMMSEGGGENV